MTFKEFMAMQEDLTPPTTTPQASTNPVQKNNMLRTLQNVQRMPVPAGVNASKYKQILQNAFNIARQGNAAHAADAVNTANVQASLQQN